VLRRAMCNERRTEILCTRLLCHHDRVPFVITHPPYVIPLKVSSVSRQFTSRCSPFAGEFPPVSQATSSTRPFERAFFRHALIVQIYNTRRQISRYVDQSQPRSFTTPCHSSQLISLRFTLMSDLDPFILVGRGIQARLLSLSEISIVVANVKF